jgi:hypothetical protein
LRHKLAILLILFTVFIAACNKYDFSIKDITETDENGNLMGNIDGTDWKLLSIDSYTNSDKEIFNRIMNAPENELFFKGRNISQMCTKQFTFAMRAFPNPIMEGKVLKFKIDTDIEIAYWVGATFDRKKNHYSTTGGLNFMSEEYVDQAADKKDFTLYYIVVDKDSCAYFGKGDVIIKK